jgi:predicted nucleic acid-binding protein
VDAARVIPPVLLDNSAWARLNHPGLSRERQEELADAAEHLRFRVCLPFLLEAGFSARDAPHHRSVMAQLLAMPRIEMDADAESRALEAQSELASLGHHRIPPSDLLIAALADRHQLGILHYDDHYDLILERTDLRYESVWLAEPGSL